MATKTVEAVNLYHERTKHHFNRYAHGPGYMDWANQPNPFRRFIGAPLIFLPPIVGDDSPSYQSLFQPEVISPVAVTAQSLSRFFELSSAVSAWKQAGDSRWALRSNPSSGNLHPTEGYLILHEVEGIHSKPGVFHYAPKEHGLELRTEFSPNIFGELVKGFPEETFLVGLSSIHWREAWKYGERAFRYCQHDIGHMLAALRVAAQVLGWRLVLLEDVADNRIRQVLGLDPSHGFDDAELEHPDLMAAVFFPTGSQIVPLNLDSDAVKNVSEGIWLGKANRLSENHVPWDIIDVAAEASVKPEMEAKRGVPIEICSRIDWGGVRQTPRFQRITARQIIRQRRSAVAFDGVTSISDQEFYAMLSHLSSEPSHLVMPWDAVTWTPSIHLLLFVHRVRNLPSGLYFLVRNPGQEKSIRQATHPEFIWQKQRNCPDGLNLYLLKEGNFQTLAAEVSCNQDIAGQSAFSLGMIAYFASNVEEPWRYRRLFWESGMVGQMLYLAAEFFGVRSTGIGCYFDDPVHEILGLKDNFFQSLYHFTVGGSVEDKRLTTHASYSWSCENPAGRYSSRRGRSEAYSLGEKVKQLPEQAVVDFEGKSIARIGAGLQGFFRNLKQGTQALRHLIKGPINLLEVAPDETDGADEILLGGVLNDILEQDQIDPARIFIVCQAGMIGGWNGRMVDGMKSRGIPFHEIETLDLAWRWCIHPDFLKDQMSRSIHRTGLGAIDLFLVRIPIKVVELLGKGQCLDRIRSAFRFLQSQVDSGRIQAFGLVSQALTLPEDNSRALSLASLLDQDFPGFKAIAFHGNFVDDAAFQEDSSGQNLVDRAREKGILTLVGSPLRAEQDGKAFLLVDSPEPEEIERNKVILLKEAETLEAEIQKISLLDGRTLGGVLSQGNISSPFKLKILGSPFFEITADSARQLTEREEQIQRLRSRAETLGDQLSNAGLMEVENYQRILETFDHFWNRVRMHCRYVLRGQTSLNGKVLRERYFPGISKSRSLAHLGIRWVLDRGVDIVLNHMSQEEYADEMAQILESLGE